MMPHLDNCADGLHPSWGSWARFLSTCELMDTMMLDVCKGWSWYRKTNCHYFVRPDGTIRHRVYGYHGRNMWTKLMEKLGDGT